MCLVSLFFIYLKHCDCISSNLRLIQKKKKNQKQTLPPSGINSNLFLSNFIGKEVRYDKKNVLLWALCRAAAAQTS